MHRLENDIKNKGYIPSWILSNREEEKLNIEEKKKYYEKLQIFCKARKLAVTTPGATTIAPKLKRPTEKIATWVCNILAGGPVEVVTDGFDSIPKEPVIFASTHQGILDNFIWLIDNHRHTIILHGAETNRALLLAQLNTGLILVTKDKSKPEKRINSKLDMITLLLNGHSVFMCPETTWNLSPNKLHLPINNGFLDVARKSGCPVVPVVIEYTYDTASEKERIVRVHIRYEKAIYVKDDDGFDSKMEEYKESISTARWECIAEKGLFSRNEITNYEYINFLKGNYRNLKLGKISRERERNGMQGVREEFYVFHHINDIPWNEKGELLRTPEVERLKRINRAQGI